MTPKLQIIALVEGLGGSRVWPEPLAAHVAEGRVQLECVVNLFDAAALVGRQGRGGRQIALLLDAGLLSACEIDLLKILKNHKSLRIWLLPARYGVRPRTWEMAEIGAVAWDETVLALERILQEAPTQEGNEGNKRDCDLNTYLSRAHNNPPERGIIASEISVAEDFTSRYDEPYSQSALSDPEMRALLGTPD